MEKQDNWFKKHIFFVIIVVLIALIFISVILGGRKTKQSNSIDEASNLNVKEIETQDSSFGVKYDDLDINEKDRICREIESRYNNCLEDYSISYCNERFGGFGTKVFANHRLYEQEDRLKMVNYCYP